MNWKIPNQLTVGRIALSVVFFILLGLYNQQSANGPWLLNAAFVIYLLAGITDVLDGWIARKYNWTSAFGRIADPFVDKVLVLGAFIMLTGSNFAMLAPPPDAIAAAMPRGHFEWTLEHWINGRMVSAVQAWMVVVILCRELLVSAVRGYSESQGIKFPATPAGKIKMFVQSFAICCVLFQVANVPQAPWAVLLKVASVWLAVVVTVASGLAYIGKIRQVFREDDMA